jgi:type II secretory pathway pseudopilin PulG
MKTALLRLPRRGTAAGFTIIEVIVAVAVAMILLFGTLYSASESLSVVEESDRRVHVVGQARSGMDRMLGDCRYASNVDIAGDSVNGWVLTIDTTSALDPPVLTYTWVPGTGEFRLTDGVIDDVLFENVIEMDVTTDTEMVGGLPVITALYVTMKLASDGPGFQGAADNAVSFELGGSVRVNG